MDQEYKCIICIICKDLLPPTSQIDHILPLYQGGSNDRENLQGLCSPCHDTKTTQDSNDYNFKISALYDKLS